MQGDELRAAAFQFADGLWHSERENQRRTDFLLWASQYAGRPITSLIDFEERIAAPAGSASLSGRTTRNLTRTLVDTAMSRYAKSETRVQYLTNGGTEEDEDKAETGTDAANALIEQTGSEIELRKGALHSCVFDLGIVKKIDTDDGPEVEHIPSWELMFDPADAHRGKPRIRCQRAPLDRTAVIVKFLAPVEGETQQEQDAREDKIRQLNEGYGTALVTPDHTQTDQHVIVYELFSDPIGRHVGRHVVMTESVLLADDEIPVGTQKNAPYVLFGYSQSVTGAYPTSIAAIVSELQLEIDGMKTRRSQILRLCAVPRYVSTGPDAAQMDVQVRGGSDAIGDVIHVPVGSTLTALDPGVGQALVALRQEEDAAWSKGFEMVGVNPSNAVGSRPNGLNSAPAQREWNDIAQDRLSLPALEYQQAHVDLATLLLDSVSEMPDYEISIKSPNGRFLKKVKTSELNLATSDYVIQRFPIGALPTTPTGKLAAAGDLLQMGAIDKDQFQQIVQLPDLKKQLNMNLASQDATAAIIAEMLKTGEYIAPPDCLEPKYALKYATYKWLTGIAAKPKMDQHRLDLLQNWMDNLTAKAKASDASAAPTSGPPGAGGMVGGQPAPLNPGGIAPLQNHEFAPPPGFNGAAVS